MSVTFSQEINIANYTDTAELKQDEFFTIDAPTVDTAFKFELSFNVTRDSVRQLQLPIGGIEYTVPNESGVLTDPDAESVVTATKTGAELGSWWRSSSADPDEITKDADGYPLVEGIGTLFAFNSTPDTSSNINTKEVDYANNTQIIKNLADALFPVTTLTKTYVEPQQLRTAIAARITRCFQVTDESYTTALHDALRDAGRYMVAQVQDPADPDNPDALIPGTLEQNAILDLHIGDKLEIICPFEANVVEDNIGGDTSGGNQDTRVFRVAIELNCVNELP